MKFSHLKKFRGSAAWFLVLFLAGCTTSPPTKEATLNTAENHEYCASFFIYSMCAKDSSGDGEVDFMYFVDTDEAFLYREGVDQSLLEGHDMHECAMIMDKPIHQKVNRLLTINEYTSYLTKSDIKNDLMIDYMRYLPKIRKCKSQQQANHGEEIFSSDDKF